MFNSIHKLFDYVIIDLCCDSLSTSAMQYGYENNHSTTMCTVIPLKLSTTTLMATVMFTVVYETLLRHLIISIMESLTSISVVTC